MPDTHTPERRAARDEKLQAIAAMFGPDVAARLGLAAPRAAQEPTADPDRVAWHQNRLIRHLRDHAPKPGTAAASEAVSPIGDTASPPAPVAPRAVPQSRAATTLPGLGPATDVADLAGEHPAIIAHILRAEPQSVWVSALKRLPGHTARAVMHRLRTP